MTTARRTFSLQSYAFQLRRCLLAGAPVEKLLDLHQDHRQCVDRLSSSLKVRRLSIADRFAWRFIREVNILRPGFVGADAAATVADLSGSDLPSTDSRRSEGVGVYQDLTAVIRQVRHIWFSEMTEPPRVTWLKHYSVRKLAHYSFKDDEIAFSLIFDFPDTPAEILSYLAYHELLHRQLGAQRINGRRYAHTRDFKDRESLFPNRRRMDETLTQYIRNAG